MRIHKKSRIIILASIGLALTGLFAWPVLQDHLGDMRDFIITFKEICQQQPLLSYLIFSAVFMLVLFIGLPGATFIMLLAGVIYNFWEAALVVSICRLMVAVITYMLLHYMLDENEFQPIRQPILLRNRPRKDNPSLLARCMKPLESKPKLSLFFLRLAPIPDGVVNYTSSASPHYRLHQYVAVSLLGMLPFTLFCAWLGERFGSVGELIRYMQ